MKSAYNESWLRNLQVMKEAKQWRKSGFISGEQLEALKGEYQSGFYHPNLFIRIILFLASLIALAGVTGLLVLMFADIGEEALSIMSLLYGIVSFLFLEKFFIRKNHHYKSGVNEALLYHAIGFTVGGIAGIFDFDADVFIVSCVVVFSFSAFRYLDLISTLAALSMFAYLIFFEMYEIGGIVQQVIPIAFMVCFSPLYFYFRKLKQHKQTENFENCLTLAEAFCLIMIYAAGNYLVVRELSINLLNLELAFGEDIPLAIVFYVLTVAIPIAYLFFGIKNKDVVLLRVSLAALAFSVFTFKYYYSTGHHEITFTTSGAALILIALGLFRYFKVSRNGYTHENLLKEKWAEMNPEAFVISQTMGGNQVTVDDSFKGGGGSFGGGGASGKF